MTKKAEGKFSAQLLDQLLSGSDAKTVLAYGRLVRQQEGTGGGDAVG